MYNVFALWKLGVAGCGEKALPHVKHRRNKSIEAREPSASLEFPWLAEKRPGRSKGRVGHTSNLLSCERANAQGEVVRPDTSGMPRGTVESPGFSHGECQDQRPHVVDESDQEILTHGKHPTGGGIRVVRSPRYN
jgi:hypothetical protein